MKKAVYLLLFSIGFYLLISFVYTQFWLPKTDNTENSGLPAGAKPALVDFDAYAVLAQEAKTYRANRLVTLDQFLQMSQDPNTVILDARSSNMYEGKHLKGAIHLNFSDFTQDNLARVIPSINSRILIYCNNNFEGDPVFFPTKEVDPEKFKYNLLQSSLAKPKPVSLALNVPTFINLYGYGYRNLFELSELVEVNDPRLAFEGTGDGMGRK